MIPFYQSTEWNSLRRVPAVLNGQLVFAYENPARWRVANSVTTQGTVDGQPATFTLTHGRGRGEIDRHCVYVLASGAQWFIYTGTSHPESLVLEFL